MKRKKKLIRQLLLPYLFITLLSLTGLVAYASVALRHFLLDQSRSDLEIRTRLLQGPVSAFFVESRLQDLNGYCKSLGRATATRITVILPSGKVVGDSSRDPARMDNHGSRPEVVDALSGQTASSIRYSRTLGRQMMYVAVPLKQGDNGLVAVLRVAIPITFIDNELTELQGKLALGGILVALLAGGVSLLISKRISRPITAMKDGAQRFAAGDLAHRLPLPDTEELSALADALNRMAAELERRIDTMVSQRNELSAVLSSMREGVIAVDMDERIVSTNRAAADMFGTEPEEMQGRKLMEIMRNLDLQRFVRRAMMSTDAIEGDLELHTKGRRILNAHSAPLVAADGTPMGTLIVLNDVTELRCLEGVRQDFVANVSHEMKTPLTAIKGFVETIRHDPPASGADTHRFLGIIERHVNRLNTIVDDLLTLSRLEQKDRVREINLQNTPIKKVLRTALQVCQSGAEEKQILLDLTCPDDLTAMVDETLLEQALINLIDNAVKYSDPGTTVTLVAAIEDAGLSIRVHDQGRGIAKKHLPRLFERFYRIDKARSRKLGGTGLGLSIVKHIVQSHGGRVNVESTLGRGSTFTIHLPEDLVPGS